MTRYANNAFAIVAALMLTLIGFHAVVTVPAAAAAPAAIELA